MDQWLDEQMKTTLYKRLFSLLILTTLKSVGQEKITLTPIDLTKLPAGTSYEGDLKAGHRWTDRNGDNIVITTETKAYQSEKFEHESDGTDKELFAYHYIIKDNKATPTWRVYDYISDCPVDITVSFIHGAFKISDLDKNGIGEVWLMYKTACRGDISPADMKIIMYENGKKFAMRGTEKRFGGTDDKGNEHYMGGEYKFDEAFTKAPESFRIFAKKLWNDNLKSVVDE